MPSILIRKLLPAFIALLLFSLTANADSLQQGMSLYEKQQYIEAFPLIEKSAKAGNAEAQFQLGKMYQREQGTKQDYKKAVEWYTKSARQGFSNAQNNLGLMYQNGLGVTKDLTLARCSIRCRFYLS